MPSTRISTGLWAQPHAPAVIEAVQSALLTTLRLPDYDRDIVLDLYPPDRRIVPSGRSDRFTRIEISLFSGRSLPAKRALYLQLVANLGELGVPADEIKIVLNEVPAQDWGIRGGRPASEVDLGFKVDV